MPQTVPPAVPHPVPHPAPVRTRRDRCPGVLRPWPADDGALARVRLLGGVVTADQLCALSRVAREHGDGDLHLTGRANLQLRALPSTDGALDEAVVGAIEACGLLPSRTHELARNVMVSPGGGDAHARTGALHRVAGRLDDLLCADPGLAALPGRFLFTLDDGSGDLHDQAHDLGLVALDAASAQLRLGRAGWGATVSLDDAPLALVELARAFVARRGTGPSAPWHVDELDDDLAPPAPPDPRTGRTSTPLPHDERHVAAPGGVLGPELVDRIVGHRTAGDDRPLVVTPWRGVLVS